MRKSALALTTSILLSLTSVAYAAPQMEVGFSPPVNGQSALSIVLGAINGAQKQILMASYSFTSKPIAAALVEAKQRGVDVRVLADKESNMNQYSGLTYMANKGVPVRLNDRYAIMHNKYIVVDGQDVETGSFNYTQAAASKNAENALLLRGVPDLAGSYIADFRKLWGEGQEMGAAY